MEEDPTYRYLGCVPPGRIARYGLEQATARELDALRIMANREGRTEVAHRVELNQPARGLPPILEVILECR